MLVKSSIKDVNPQFFKGRITETAANTFTQLEYALPTVQQLANGKALVMEILKIFIDLEKPSVVNVQQCSVAFALYTKTSAAIKYLNDADVILSMSKNIQIFDSAATDATVAIPECINPSEFDFTDGQGNGILVGTTKMFAGIVGTANSAAKTANFAILYRLKEVSAVELIGMIQNN